jgi:hypothetical protein
MKKYLKGVLSLVLTVLILLPFVVKAETVNQYGIGEDKNSIVFDQIPNHTKYGITIKTHDDFVLQQDVTTGNSFQNIYERIKEACDNNAGKCEDDYGDIYHIDLYAVDPDNNDEPINDTLESFRINLIIDNNNHELNIEPENPMLQLFFKDETNGSYTISFEDMEDMYKGDTNHSIVAFLPYDSDTTLVVNPAEGKLFIGWYEANPETGDPTDNLISGTPIYVLRPDGRKFYNITPVFADSSDNMCTITVDANEGNLLNFPVPNAVQCGTVLLVGEPSDDNVERPFAKIFDAYEIAGERIEVGSNYTVNENVTIKILWKDNSETVTKNAGDGEFQIEFNGEKNHTYEFSMVDVFTIQSANDEELLEIMGIDANNFTEQELTEFLTALREGLNTTIEQLKELSKEEGTFINAYGIEVFDTTTNPPEKVSAGPEFKIRIKATDEMKKYNTVKLIYFNDSMEKGEIVTLTLNGDYYEGILPHLSAYVLTGKNVEEENKPVNPATGDNIALYIGLLIVGVGGVAITTVTLKKKKN